MEHQIDLTAQHRPEVLERILRVVRHRGFTVTQMDMQLIDGKVRLKFAVKVCLCCFLFALLIFHAVTNATPTRKSWRQKIK